MLSIEELLNPVETSPNAENAPGTGESQDEPLSHHDKKYPSDKTKQVEKAKAHTQQSSPTTVGPVNFPPFENVDERAIREIRKFQIRQFGYISSSCEHIPYHSLKKDFSAKTGRQRIEAFKYTFQLPGQSTEYPIMWDYNIGLVRIAAFFKCMGFSKTKASQILDKNPGLRDVCPSITGGAVHAQGYWMPYDCARALCATFCHKISGALIPIFGPDFPQHCTPPNLPYYGDMLISQQLIKDAREKASRLLGSHADQTDRSNAFTQQPPDQFLHVQRIARTPIAAPVGRFSHGKTQRIDIIGHTRKRDRDSLSTDDSFGHNRTSAVSRFTEREACLSQSPFTNCHIYSADGNVPMFGGHSAGSASINKPLATSPRRKRRRMDSGKPFDDMSNMQHESHHIGRRALPGSGVPSEAQNLEIEQRLNVLREEYSAASALVNMGSGVVGRSHFQGKPDPSCNLTQRRRSI
ncbi:hypothetical protein QQS21_003486 [Conoideocrella luteorostrata]|uniref:HTH APSES-type domain-containing protein n=1 Tax=Conoideocrella luteorostrata TaxID=1105319 RepID=A0AAJ0CT98_9HYPO|nr:hypothetical protein QQS21_003486 [Conoideocrella luteorostrata]